MRFFNNIKISQKLPAAMVLICVASLAMMGTLGYFSSREALETAARTQLMSTASARRKELEAYLTSAISDITAQAANPLLSEALKEFGFGWRAIGDGQTEYLQQQFITNNPYPAGERNLLEYAEDSNTYSRAHRKYHPYFNALSDAQGYGDVFLFDVNGNLIYSTYKNDGFATNFLDGPFKNSTLAEAFRAAMDLTDGTNVFLSDFETNSPSGGEAAQFLSVPIPDARGGAAGVLAYRLPDDRVDAILQASEGLGESGEVFAVGPDLIMRSNFRLSEEPVRFKRRIDLPDLQGAFEGQSGLISEFRLNNHDVVAAFEPLSVLGLNWAIVTVQNHEEMIAAISVMRNELLWQGVFALVLISATAVVVARSVGKPLVRVSAAMREIAGAKYDVLVPDTGRSDEIGGIANTLESFRKSLLSAEESAAESLFKGAAFESSSAALMILDEDRRVSYLNASARSLFEKHQTALRLVDPRFEAQNVVGQGLSCFHPDPNRLGQIVKDPANLPQVDYMALGDARIALEISAIKGEGDEHIGCVIEWNDVTLSQRRNAILDAIETTQATAEFGLDGKLVTANQRFAELAATEKDALIGMSYEELLDPVTDDAEAKREKWQRLQKGESVYGQFQVAAARQGNGTGGGVLEGSFSPVLDGKNVPVRILLIGNDVTEAQNKLAQANAERAQMAGAQTDVVEALRVGLKNLSDGDLCFEIENAFSANYEQLRVDFNQAAQKLRQAMARVVENADSIRGEASDISVAADDLSRRTEKQAATLEETAAALDELTSSVKSAAEGAAQANEVVSNARASAESSSEVVAEAVTAMSEIEASSERISKIIGVIDDIAFQTNLLALNAGVEAARAGEAGRGFAVVASEVRSLAQRSSNAAREINQLISKSGQHVKRGVGLVGQTGNALRQIISSVGDISSLVSELAVSAKEQSSGLAEINISVNELDQVTQQNAAMFEQTTAASHSLTREAETLSRTMGLFQTGADQPTERKPLSHAAKNQVPVMAKSKSIPAFASTDGSSALAETVTANMEAQDWEEF